MENDYKLLSNISVFGNWMLMHQIEWAMAYQGVAILERYRRFPNCVVTAGAYLGMESFFYALWFKRLVMFEPSTDLYDFINQTFQSNTNAAINTNRCDWSLHKLALGAKHEQRNLTKVYHEGYSIVTAPYSAIDQDRSKFQGDTTRIEPIEVVPLDSLGLSPDLIQLDVEGFEDQALEGAIQTIQENRPVIQLESITEQTERFLFDHGYTEVKPWINYMDRTDVALDRYYIHNSVSNER